MDKDQLIKALADAATAAKPAQEYCLFWIDWWPMCLTKSEWAGWMQGVGSLLAVVGAGAFPYWLKWRADKESFNRARQCLLMQCALIGEIHTLASVQGATPVAVLRGAKHNCANLVAMHAEVRPPHMSLHQFAVWRASGVTVSQLSELVDKAFTASIPNNAVVPALLGMLQDSTDQLNGFGKKAAR
jgi:hypothetical protein